MRATVELDINPLYRLEFDSKVRHDIILVTYNGYRQPVCVPDLAVIWAYLDAYLTAEEKARGIKESPLQAYE